VRVEAEFFRLVVEGEVFEVVGVDRPVKFVAEVLHQRGEGADVAEVGGGHGGVCGSTSGSGV
jgi:hypothetical protein